MTVLELDEMKSTASTEDFKEYLAKRSRPNTVQTYMAAFEEYLTFLDGDTPTRENAQEFVDDLMARGLAPNTVCVKANAVRRWFKWQGNPIALDTPSVNVPEPKYITTDELGRLLAKCDNALEKALIVGLFDTACRISELLNLKTDDIDWGNGLIKVTRKGGKEAWVNASDKCLIAFKDWLDARQSKSKNVFMDIDYQRARLVIQGVGNRAGIELHPHMFRHSRAVQMLLAGTEPHIVQQHLGHTSIRTTLDIYGRLMPVHLKKEIPEW